MALKTVNLDLDKSEVLHLSLHLLYNNDLG